MQLAHRDRLSQMAQDLKIARLAQAADGKAVANFIEVLEREGN